MTKMSAKLIMLYLLLVQLVAVMVTVSGENNDQVQVNIANGPIVGETFDMGRSRQIHRFLGIPYAEPPVGELRFKKTQPLKHKWSEPLQATKWPTKCMQDVNHPWNAQDDKMHFNHGVSEDCLFLNIWSPAIENDETKLRPVIVWIHGGALFMGTASMTLYDGKMLANMADAVVVSINYRLSTLGFLYSDQVEGVKGNQGLWDQAMSLEWIQENIRYFGGDPNKVTIVGESAGGWSVSALILSPVSRNLFHNAILMSGAIDNRVVAKPEDMVKAFLKGIRKVGCATEHETSISQEVFNCINNLPVEQIDQIVHYMYEEKLMFPHLLTVDGEFFPDLPVEMLKNGDYKTNVNLLAETVENEGSFMVKHLEQFRGENPAPISLEEAKAFANEFVNEKILFDKTEKIDKDNLLKLYFNGLHPLDDQDLFRNRATIAYGDLLLNCPVINFAQAIKAHSPEKASVFQLFYRVHLGVPKFLCSKWSGACHTDDLFSFFALPFQMPEYYIDRERDVSNEMINFVSDFIRTGKPNLRMPEWQEFFIMEDNSVVRPYYDLNNHATTYENFKLNLKQSECRLMSRHM